MYYFCHLIESLSEVQFASFFIINGRGEPHWLLLSLWGRKHGILILKCIDWWFDFDSKLITSTNSSLYNYSIWD